MFDCISDNSLLFIGKNLLNNHSTLDVFDLTSREISWMQEYPLEQVVDVAYESVNNIGYEWC